MNWIQRFLTAIATHKADVNAHHAQVHGAAQHTDVTREHFMPWTEAYLVVNAVDSIWGAELADAAMSEAYFFMKVPDDFVSFTSVKAVWKCHSPNGAVNMYWTISAYWGAAGEADDNSVDVPAMGATAHAGHDLITEQLPANALTLTGLTLGDYLALGFYRDATNGLDTIDDVAYLIGLLFTYVGHQ